MIRRISREAVKTARYVYISWGNDETDIVNDETGEVLYTAPSYPRALDNAPPSRRACAIMRAGPVRTLFGEGEVMNQPRYSFVYLCVVAALAWLIGHFHIG